MAAKAGRIAGGLAARAAWLAGMWLSILLAFGLWQGYGKWLFASGGAHVQ
ncbi:MAG TPA: hypothetical protein VGO61_15945 [Steroidobacteraceae bacterium]|nr:hypothetical protein [Steroidobacteraceae bacterium]